MLHHAFFRRSVLIAAILMVAAHPAAAVMPTGSFGLGVIIGEPTGLSGAFTLSPQSSIDGALAYSYARQGDWQIHSDYLFTGNRVFQNEPPGLEEYLGGGLRLKFESSTRFGIRVPVGATYQIDGKSPFQFFGEIAPILDLAPGLDLSINIGVGARYYF